jgi:DNA-binding NtrC family response regulator
VDARVVSSTNRDLHAAMAQDTFREDLYYRLNVFHLHVPPLRERREDIAALASSFLQRSASAIGKGPLRLTPEAERALAAHDWPGNVRELQNLMERAAVVSRSELIEPELLHLAPPPEAATAQLDTPPEETFRLEPAVQQVERKVILRALAAAGDNKPRAAQLLGVSERTLWYKLKRYGL